MTYLDFEKPVQDLETELEKLKEVAAKSKVDLGDKIKELEGHIIDKTYQFLAGFG